LGKALDDIARLRGNNTDWRILLYLRGVLFGGVKGLGEQPGSCGILVFFRAFLRKVLLEENIFERYDRFILTRSDYLHEAPHIPPGLLTDDNIWIPDGERYGSYTNRHMYALVRISWSIYPLLM
jgi:hypothetical protein